MICCMSFFGIIYGYQTFNDSSTLLYIVDGFLLLFYVVFWVRKDPWGVV